jgi:hypothetical protein
VPHHIYSQIPRLPLDRSKLLTAYPHDMLIIALLVVMFHLTSSTPLPAPIEAFDTAAPLTVFGRELPDCMNVARYRTMQSIIWSCLTTIFACAWVSIHPNVPDPRYSGWRRFIRRMAQMINTLITPSYLAVGAEATHRGSKTHGEVQHQVLSWR